ncbi:MAG: hypothetical protein JWP53_1376 [Conexibacter sp.]|nr:hypothetical protein [Conexibacter sp.]
MTDVYHDDPSKLAARQDEDEGQRLDRELLELLNELRVVMPGVQVLFGFLLTVPFQQGFQRIDGFQRDVYFVTLLLIGMLLLALAMNGALLLLTDVLFGSLTVAITVACSVTLFGWLWFGVALRRLASGKTEW